MTFIAATNNKGKFEEIKRILQPLGHEVISMKQANVCVNIDETAKTFEGNAEIKALAVSRATNNPVIADDSGLVVDALGGRPGIYSSRYAGPNSSDLDRINKLLRELSDVPDDKRTARFICCVCCIFPDGRIIRTKGCCEGKISFNIHKDGGFGYDPVFIEKQSGKAFSELSSLQKDTVSHRGKAFGDFVRKLKEMDIK